MRVCLDSFCRPSSTRTKICMTSNGHVLVPSSSAAWPCLLFALAHNKADRSPPAKNQGNKATLLARPPSSSWGPSLQRAS